MLAETYLAQVLRWIPPDIPDRHEIAHEIESVIAERTAEGEPLASILARLGEPIELAESYLVDYPMASASLARRLLAKLVDLGLFYLVVFLVIGSGIALMAAAPTPQEGDSVVRLSTGFLPELRVADGTPLLTLLLLLGGGLAVAAIIAPTYGEWRWGQSPGKYLLGLRVVRESGAMPSLGQVLLRYVPLWFQFFWIDMVFALFGPMRQRAFERLTHTRTIATRNR